MGAAQSVKCNRKNINSNGGRKSGIPRRLRKTEYGVDARCNHCGQWWPFTEEFFSTNPGHFGGLSAWCRACLYEYNRSKRLHEYHGELLMQTCQCGHARGVHENMGHDGKCQAIIITVRSDAHCGCSKFVYCKGQTKAEKAAMIRNIAIANRRRKESVNA